MSVDICKDKPKCAEITTTHCRIFPSVGKDCPSTCKLCICRDNKNCSEVSLSLCSSYPEIKRQCMKTCKVCEDRKGLYSD